MRNFVCESLELQHSCAFLHSHTFSTEFKLAQLQQCLVTFDKIEATQTQDLRCRAAAITSSTCCGKGIAIGFLGFHE
jgi:hypothetical protein